MFISNKAPGSAETGACEERRSGTSSLILPILSIRTLAREIFERRDVGEQIMAPNTLDRCLFIAKAIGDRTTDGEQPGYLRGDPALWEFRPSDARS